MENGHLQLIYPLKMAVFPNPKSSNQWQKTWGLGLLLLDLFLRDVGIYTSRRQRGNNATDMEMLRLRHCFDIQS